MSIITLSRVLVRGDHPEGKVSAWLGKHRISLLTMLPVFGLVAMISIINFNGFPGRVNDDEGTYVAQAWAVLFRGELAHYTYWYDHPPLGWLQIAGYAWLTDGFHRAATAVTVGREFMVLMHMLACAMMYVLARRLNFHRVTGAAAVLLFTFSPVALYYHRMVFLDNIAIMWALAALVFAASPRRSLAAAFGSAMCFATAVLTKETAAVLLPVVLWVLIQNQPKVGRGWGITVFLSSFIGASLFYPLYAVLKNELVEGPGHVSLIWAIKWQLFERAGTGSVLDPSTVSYQTVEWWLQTDSWLLVAGAVLVIPALFVRRLRPLAIGLGIQLAMLVRGGYLPQPYVIALIPLSAILLAGMGEVFIRSRWFAPVGMWPNKFFARLRFSFRWSVARTGIVAVAAAIMAFGLVGSPTWASQAERASTYDPSGYSVQATDWVRANVDKSQVVITDDNIWADLVMDGYENPVWLYKADLDPAVKDKLLPNGRHDIDYLVLPDLSESLLKSLPIVWDAIQHSRVVVVYGEGDAKMIVREVIHTE